MMLRASRGSTRIGAAVATVLGADLGAALGRLEAPLGVIWGTRDRIVPISALRQIRAIRPDAVVRRFRAPRTCLRWNGRGSSSRPPGGCSSDC